MKKKNIIIYASISFIVIVILFFVYTVNTTNQRKAYYESIVPDHVEMMENFFTSNDQNVKILNVDNEDKGSEFKENNIENFNQGDWDAIMDDYIKNDYRFTYAKDNPDK